MQQPGAPALLLALCMCVGVLATGGGGVTVVPASDPRVQFVGRSRPSPSGIGIDFDMPGCQIRFALSMAVRGHDAGAGAGAGAGLTIQLAAQHPAAGFQPNFFRVFVGGQPVHEFNTSTSSASTTSFPLLAPGQSLPSGSHTITVFKSTEAQWNERAVAANFLTFVSLTLPAGATLGTPPARPSRRIEFFGDSITAGYCNLCQTPGAGTGVTAESFWDSWANRVCTRLGAACHTAAWSGFGVIRNCCGGTTLMSDVFKRTLATVNGSVWDFSAWVPAAVVINLGTNDHLAKDPAVNADFVKTYFAMIETMHAAYRNATAYFLACGPMSEAYCGEVDSILNLTAQAGIRAHFLEHRGFLNKTNTCCGHPAVTADVTMAANTSAYIASVLGW